LERGRGRPRDSRSGDRRYSAGERRHEFLVVFAFPFGVGALEVFYAVLFEVPESCGDFVDQVMIVGDQQDCAFVALEGDVQGVDGFEVQVVGGFVED
jgi:hypothetical protein